MNLSCAACVVDPERRPTQWNNAVTLFDGTAYCSEHLVQRLQADLRGSVNADD